MTDNELKDLSRKVAGILGINCFEDKYPHSDSSSEILFLHKNTVECFNIMLIYNINVTSLQRKDGLYVTASYNGVGTEINVAKDSNNELESAGRLAILTVLATAYDLGRFKF